MDADHFDRLTRSLNATSPRRRVSHALAGLTLSGMLVPLFFLADAEARKKRKKGKGDTKKGGKKCNQKTAWCGGCPGGAICVDGVCVFCPLGEAVCDGTCVNTDTDTLNCGTCGTRCLDGVRRLFGECIG